MTLRYLTMVTRGKMNENKNGAEGGRSVSLYNQKSITKTNKQTKLEG
jgi:hypothetical protein